MSTGGFRGRRGGRNPPPLNFQRFGYSGINVHVHKEKCVYISANSYITIIYLPLISDFISIMQALLGRSHL